MMETQMADLLPPNSTKTMRSIDDEVDTRFNDLKSPSLNDLKNVKACPEDLLAWLAFGMSVDVWDASWSEAEKRAVIERSLQVHRKKGTLSALKTALSAFDVNIEVEEWWQREPKGLPYTFSVSIPPQNIPVTTNKIKSIRRVIDETKNERSKLVGFEVRRGIEHRLDIASVIKGFGRIRMSQKITGLALKMSVKTAVAFHAKQYVQQKWSLA